MGTIMVLSFLLGAIGWNIANPVPKLSTIQEIAKYSKCEPARIAYWSTQHDYEVQKGWDTSEVCMVKDKWDCKCHAVVSRDTLIACGYDARIVTLSHGNKYHAITIYPTKGA